MFMDLTGAAAASPLATFGTARITRAVFGHFSTASIPFKGNLRRRLSQRLLAPVWAFGEEVMRWLACQNSVLAA
jgi:hypothetical protein